MARVEEEGGHRALAKKEAAMRGASGHARRLVACVSLPRTRWRRHRFPEVVGALPSARSTGEKHGHHSEAQNAEEKKGEDV
jgi:hypothetical protein